MVKLIEGKSLAIKLEEEIILKIAEIKDLLLVTILVGKNPTSQLYIRKKEDACKRVGINFKLKKFVESASEEEITRKIKELNKNEKVTGILVQLPLPKNLDVERIINTILPEKDVDGLTKTNMGYLKNGNERLACCTAKGIIKLLKTNNISLKDKNVVIVGYGRLVGRPLSLMLKNRKVRFKICDADTVNLKEETKNADILISAAGVPNLIEKDHIKEGAIVIDVGSAKLNEKIVGDVNFEEVKEKASFITPRMGGVGPLTIAMLLENLIICKQKQLSVAKG